VASEICGRFAMERSIASADAAMTASDWSTCRWTLRWLRRASHGRQDPRHPGQAVKQGETLVVLEAMKMELPIAPRRRRRAGGQLPRRRARAAGTPARELA
jgi:hypothetical protein